MISRKISAYMDAELTQKMEAMVFNLLPTISHSSDMAMLYIAETDIVDTNGLPTQTKMLSGDSFFISVIDEAGYINFESIKTIHVPGVLASDFKNISYFPSPENMKLFSTYYEGREVPSTGGFMDFAFCPFAVNTIQLLNGDQIDVYGKGRMWITAEQRGLKGYTAIPEVKEILSAGYFKILKLAIYSKYTSNLGSTLSLNLFSPSMTIEQEPLTDRMSLADDKISLYSNSKDAFYGEFGYMVNQKDGSHLPSVRSSQGEETLLYGIKNRVYVQPDGYIDASSVKDDLTPEFTIHVNAVVRGYADRGTVVFELGYAKGSASTFTRHMTLWLNSDGYIMYNCAFMNESINTRTILKKDIENSISFTISNETYDEDDDDEFVTFIHLNGNQIWPKEDMLYEYQRDYLWKALEAYKTYNEVCMSLPAPPPTTGAIDARHICTQKLLHESGFEDMETLMKVYQLYLDRPRANDADMNTRKINFNNLSGDDPYDSRVEAIVFGQDAYLDTEDSAYYADIEFSDILVCKKRLNRAQIEQIHLLNTLKVAAIES